MSFDLELVRNYIHTLSKAGRQALKGLAPQSQVEIASLPILSWAYYNHSLLNPQSVLVLLEKDSLRSNFITGHDIIYTDDTSTNLFHERMCSDALNLITEAWPSLGVLSEIIVKRVSYVRSEFDFESVSDPKIFGQIYFNMQRATVTGWAEIIAHEVGHQYLFAVSSKTTFHGVINWSEEFFSPIRGTKRPLIGVLHGAFSQALMISLAGHYLKSGIQDEQISLQCQQILKSHASGLLEAVNTLDRMNVLNIDSGLRAIFSDGCTFARDVINEMD